VKIKIRKEKPFNYEERLVLFAADCIAFIKTLDRDEVGIYYSDQILRSSGSSALHYGEAQGANTSKDFIHKVSGTIKELKETRVSLKILEKAQYGATDLRAYLIGEIGELVSIGNSMILNKKKK